MVSQKYSSVVLWMRKLAVTLNDGPSQDRWLAKLKTCVTDILWEKVFSIHTSPPTLTQS